MPSGWVPKTRTGGERAARYRWRGVRRPPRPWLPSAGREGRGSLERQADIVFGDCRAHRLGAGDIVELRHLHAPAEGVDRTQLWLAWNYLVRDGAVGEAGRSQDYPAGANRFASVADAGAAHDLVTSEYGDCGLGRTGYAVTGW